MRFLFGSCVCGNWDSRKSAAKAELKMQKVCHANVFVQPHKLFSPRAFSVHVRSDLKRPTTQLAPLQSEIETGAVGGLYCKAVETWREEDRMWVFIRPGVVRSANESEVKLGQQFCPIHRFDRNYQFLDLLRMRLA